MPRLTTKVEGRGNGIKTVVPNMVDIAKALNTPPAYPTKFLGIELGAQSKFNKKDERAIVNGKHMANDMQASLGKFIDLFILCPNCGLPEISMAVKKSSIKIDCAACGHNAPIPTSHKLTTYILKNPPGKSKGSSGKSGKKERRSKKDKGSKAGEDGKADGAVGAADLPEGEVEWFTDTSKAAQKKRREAEFAAMTENSGLSAEVEKLLVEAKEQNKEDSPSTVLKIFLLSKKRSVSEIVSELRRVQLSRGLDEPQRLKVLLEAIIDTSDVATVHTQLGDNAELLSNFAKDRNSGTTLINCLEELVGVTEPKLMVRVPHILQVLYEKDVLDEDTILAWADSPPESSWLVNKEVATEVREKAMPIVNWLRSAESESDSEEEDDE